METLDTPETVLEPTAGRTPKKYELPLIVVAKLVGIGAGIVTAGAVAVVTSFGDCQGPDGSSTACGTSALVYIALVLGAIFVVAALLPRQVPVLLAAPIYLACAVLITLFGLFTGATVMNDGPSFIRTLGGLGLILSGLVCAAGYMFAIRRHNDWMPRW